MNLAVHVQGKVLSHVVVVGGVEESLPQLPGHRVTGPRNNRSGYIFFKYFITKINKYSQYIFTQERGISWLANTKFAG